MAARTHPPFLQSVAKEFPLHWSVWNDSVADLRKTLHQDNKPSVEEKDPRGLTPLYLATILNHKQCAKLLLDHGATTSAENNDFWAVYDEAVCQADPEMIKIILSAREAELEASRDVVVPGIMQRLKESPDFYMEIKWEFSSWVPLLARVCPNDTYRVWKSGNKLRVDLTLLSFDNLRWQKGAELSYIFCCEGKKFKLYELDHSQKTICEPIESGTSPTIDSGAAAAGSNNSPSRDISPETIAAKLATPVITNYLDVDKISFERAKSGFWGWRSDRLDTIDEYPCKVYSANQVQIITRTRTEHMSKDDKVQWRQIEAQCRDSNPLEKFLGAAERQSNADDGNSNGNKGGELSGVEEDDNVNNSSRGTKHNDVTAEEYFNPNIRLGSRWIGRPGCTKKEETVKIQNFKANICLCEDFPLTLQDQVLPVIDLMAEHNVHFKKLKEFIALQLPSGFPIKIEIPLFHCLTAKVTFTNVNGSQKEARGVTTLREEGGIVYCCVDDDLFDTPSDYTRILASSGSAKKDDGKSAAVSRRSMGRSGLTNHGMSDEEMMLQYAIQQSINEQQHLLQSIDATNLPSDDSSLNSPVTGSRDSKADGEEEEDRGREEEEDNISDEDFALQRALALSLMDPVMSSPAKPHDTEMKGSDGGPPITANQFVKTSSTSSHDSVNNPSPSVAGGQISPTRAVPDPIISLNEKQPAALIASAAAAEKVESSSAILTEIDTRDRPKQ